MIHCFFATSVNSSYWRWISCFMGTDATCVFFVAHGLPRLIFGSWRCLCVLSMLFKYFQCCLCVVQALIMCVVGATWALPILFCVLQVPSMLLWCYQWFSKSFKLYWWCSHAFLFFFGLIFCWTYVLKQCFDVFFRIYFYRTCLQISHFPCTKFFYAFDLHS